MTDQAGERRSPIFIVGSPRSGTTMLAGLLRESPWGEPFETHFIPKYYREAARLGDLSRRDVFLRIARGILSERPILQRGPTVTPEAIYERSEGRDYAALADAVCQACVEKNGQGSWGDKTPDYLQHVDLMHSLFPTSRFIYLVRDGRDVAMSLMERSWGPSNVFSCAEKWRRENEVQPIWSTLRTAGLLHELRYEDLLSDPASRLGKLIAFLDFEPSSDPENLTRAVRQTNQKKWKQRMTGAQIEIFERVAGDTLRRFGYETTYQPSPVHPLRATGYRAHNSLKHYRNLFMMNVVDTVRIRYFQKAPFAE